MFAYLAVSTPLLTALGAVLTCVRVALFGVEFWAVALQIQ
jgi:type IV secretory pathway TrbD component